MARLRNNHLVLTPQLISTAGATTNNLPITSSNVYISPTTNLDTITGLIGANMNGSLIFILNTHTTNTLVLSHNNVGSSTGNRLFSISGQDIYLSPNECVIGRYDSGISGYRVSRTEESVFIEVAKSTTQSIPDNTLTLVTWDVETKKRGIIHDNVTNNSRVIMPVAGDYNGHIGIGWTTWSGGFSNRFQIAIYRNGSLYRNIFDFQVASTVGPCGRYPFVLTDWAVNDYLEVYVLQNNGSARLIDQNTSRLFLKKL